MPPLSRWSPYTPTAQSSSVTKRVPREVHAQGYKWSQLLPSHLQSMGLGSWTCHPDWFALSLLSTPSGSLASRSSTIFSSELTLTLESTSCNSSSYNNKQLHPQYMQSPMSGVTWNSCCSPCPLGARRAAHHMWRVFTFHGQVQSTLCPCDV